MEQVEQRRQETGRVLWPRDTFTMSAGEGVKSKVQTKLCFSVVRILGAKEVSASVKSALGRGFWTNAEANELKAAVHRRVESVPESETETLM